ncbi:hypothetical protein JCM10449v2_003344 [Rhodotorula kratochvilovae]
MRQQDPVLPRDGKDDQTLNNLPIFGQLVWAAVPDASAFNAHAEKARFLSRGLPYGIMGSRIQLTFATGGKGMKPVCDITYDCAAIDKKILVEKVVYENDLETDFNDFTSLAEPAEESYHTPPIAEDREVKRMDYAEEKRKAIRRGEEAKDKLAAKWGATGSKRVCKPTQKAVLASAPAAVAPQVLNVANQSVEDVLLFDTAFAAA